MRSQLPRILLLLGALGCAILFAGDMLLYGALGAARDLTGERWIAVVKAAAAWRLTAGALAGPIGFFFYLAGIFGIWLATREASPRLSATFMSLSCLYALFGSLQHALSGPWEHAIRSSGSNSDISIAIGGLDATIVRIQTPIFYLIALCWAILLFRRRTQIPRWVVLASPALTGQLDALAARMPAPFGYGILGGWSNLMDLLWFLVMAIFYSEDKSAG